MRTKTNSKRRTLVALFATILALAGVLALLPKVAAATEGQGGEPQLTPAVEPEPTNNGNDAPANGNDNNNNNATVNNNEGEGKQLNVAEDTATLIVALITDPSDSDQEFEFTVVGKDNVKLDPITEGYDVVAEDGKFKLKNGQKAGFTVRSGAIYTISQTVVDGWKLLEPADAKVSEGIASIDVTAEAEKTVAFSDEQVKPEVTTKVSPQTITDAIADTKADIKDEVTLKNLEAGKKYTVEGELYLYSTKAATGIKATAEATAGEDGTATAKLEYTDVNVGTYVNDKLVSFVAVTADGKEVCSHTNIDDEEQTVTISGKGNSLTISKKILTPKTDEAIDRAQADVDNAAEDDKEKLQRWLDELKANRDGGTYKNSTGETKKPEGAVNKEFTFTVKLTDASDKELEGEFAYKDAGGKEQKIKSGGTIKLKDGQSITIADLPTGTKYEVVEKELDNWTCDQEKNTVSGEIKADEVSKADFVNTGKGSFTISKKVTASNGSLSDDLKNTEFTFTVNFYDKEFTSSEEKSYNRKDIEGEFAYTGSREGTIKSGETVTLKGGEKITFADLDPGIYVRVAETTKANWKASKTSLAGAIYDGMNRSASFTNTYSTKTASTSKKSTTSSRAALAKTADPTTIAPLAMSAFSVALVGAGALSRKRQ